MKLVSLGRRRRPAPVADRTDVPACCASCAEEERHSDGRRAVLRGSLGLFFGSLLARAGLAQPPQPEPRRMRPQAGDTFVHALGARRGELVTLDDLVEGSAPVTAWAKDPASGVVRSGSRLNQVLLVRVSADQLSEEGRASAADGVVAFSGICTHTGCDVSKWSSETQNLLCSCHDSEFDPRQQAEVMSGPAPRRLPSLPLVLEAGELRARDTFDAKIRYQRPG